MISLAQKKELGATYGKKHGLDPKLICAVVEQESGWDMWAHRYEPAFFINYVMRLVDTLHLSDTEARDRAYSWGPMQLMGQTARELKYNGELPALCDYDTGIDWGCAKLYRCMVAHPEDTKGALQMYNGGSNPNYAVEVLARYKTYL